MGKEDRIQVVLSVLEDAGVPLPPRVIMRAVKFRGVGLFELSSTKRYLEELEDRGLVVKISPDALDDREVVRVGEAGQRGYWVAVAAVQQTGNEVKDP